jgi:hypothetical protein
MQEMMGSRGHRMWHYLWHGIRNSWPRMSSAERNQIRSILGDGWTRKSSETAQNPDPAMGEEFLYMHREMIGMVQAMLGNEMYERWRQPPAPNDARWPLPNGNNFQTNQEYQQLMAWHAQATDANRLRTMTLAAYGNWLEMTIHNAMHMRWADQNKAIPGVMAGGLFSEPRPEWDLPSNDYLGSTYSAHVNVIFWRLHGYVDDRINDWLKANNYTSASTDCTTSSCYRWRGTWTGPLPAAPRSVAVAASSSAAHGTPSFGQETPPSDDDLSRFQQLKKSLARLIHDNSVMVPAVQ